MSCWWPWDFGEEGQRKGDKYFESNCTNLCVADTPFLFLFVFLKLSALYKIFKIRFLIYNIQNKVDYYSSVINENNIFRKLKGRKKGRKEGRTDGRTHARTRAHTHTHKCLLWSVYEPLTYWLLEEKCFQNCSFLQWESSKTSVVKRCVEVFSEAQWKNARPTESIL
jgi:hypothetical protein